MTNPSIVVVFDLDDTLYKEIDFLKSAFSSIAHSISLEVPEDKNTIFEKMVELYNLKQNVFEGILSIYKTSLTTDNLLVVYRNHIKLSPDVVEVLEILKKKKIPLGLLTDGRSVQQRNKIEALNLEKYFSKIIVSEEFGSKKPCVDNYKYFEDVFGSSQYYYIGDNLKKDFISPNKLGWITICLKDNGLNIHNQNIDLENKYYYAKYTVSNFYEIKVIIK